MAKRGRPRTNGVKTPSLESRPLCILKAYEDLPRTGARHSAAVEEAAVVASVIYAKSPRSRVTVIVDLLRVVLIRHRSGRIF